MKLILEYIWLDGYKTQNLRSKVKVYESDEIPDSDGNNLPEWNFDGSSTMQAPGNNSECLLLPVRTYIWNSDKNHYLVLCEVEDSSASPHSSNTRQGLRSIDHWSVEGKYWWGFEQEYFITNGGIPLGFPSLGYPQPQGLYYCGVGSDHVKGRQLVQEHLEKCLDMGINLTGTNAEVALGQWEYQCFAKDTLKACDDLIISRYVLSRLAEKYEYDINIDPKPVKGDWNGSGCHTNFSNEIMREAGDPEYYAHLFWRLEKRHAKHIIGYGENNNERLTGDHETQNINKFSWGVGDRGASIRVPKDTKKNNWKGYLEDRRPASNCDPYTVARLIVEACESEDNNLRK